MSSLRYSRLVLPEEHSKTPREKQNEEPKEDQATRILGKSVPQQANAEGNEPTEESHDYQKYSAGQDTLETAFDVAVTNQASQANRDDH
ncbi:hypothetical protein [Actinoplanes aureus]|uniref:Uncharacterized protein n=1 Tax=Actinoplanes aureus TaxID=2792083 RepID=A0A931CIW4_9ACTN|nr:hypothetical protein [Actinoplanes aureus]MBG0568817.1 hypothetical protein [Actinoplanes aureus]